jgi:hypothetical protein
MDSSGNAPDMPFALDCVRTGITQLARFDVQCGHMHEGNILEISNMGRNNGQGEMYAIRQHPGGRRGVRLRRRRDRFVTKPGAGIGFAWLCELAATKREAYPPKVPRK